MFPARFFPTRYFNARFWVKTGEVFVFVPGEAKAVYIARLTTSAPHLAATTTTTAHAAAIPGGIETATITSSTPHWARVPRSNPQ